MPYGPKCGYSDHLRGRDARNLRAAAAFAAAIGYPLSLGIDINWTRTRIGDDPDGRVVDVLMASSRKWLRGRGVAIFAWIEVRECPDNPQPCPNSHILVHCPPDLVTAFTIHIRTVLTRVAWGLDPQAIHFASIGGDNPTLKATLGKLAYLLKGLRPQTARRLGIRPAPQGRIYGKRVAVSQDIGPTRRRQAERQEKLDDPQPGLYLQGEVTAPSSRISHARNCNPGRPSPALPTHA